MSATVDIPLPARGVSELAPFSHQPEHTCREARNVRPFDVFGERLRLAKRPGLSRYNSGQVNGSAAVSDLIALSWPNPNAITYADNFPPTVDWDASVSANFNVAAACWGGDGAIYATTYIYQVVKLLPGGTVEWARSIFAPSDGAYPLAIRMAADGLHLYVAYGRRDAAAQGRVHKYRITDTALDRVWEWTLDPTVNVTCMDIDEVSLWVMGATGTMTVGAGWRFYDSGELASVYAMGTALPGMPMGVAAWGGHTAVGVFVTPIGAYADTVVRKITSDGASVWSSTVSGSLLGNVKKARTGEVAYAAGRVVATSRREVRKFTETDYSTVAATWTYTAPDYSGLGLAYVDQLDVDVDGNAYVNLFDSPTWRLRRISAAGAVEWTSTLAAAADAVLVDRDKLANAQSVSGVYAVARAARRLVQNVRAPADVSSRSIVLLAVAGGDIRVVPPTAGGPVATPAGGTAALATSLRWTRSVVFQNRVYYTDGAKAVYFEPVATQVYQWRADSAGTLPTQARILEVWRGRVCLAGNPDDPHNWHMSAVLDAHDWDYTPANPTPADAVVGNLAPAGECPDMVNAIVPLTNDIALFGCDRGIYRLTGDPLLGGVFDLVSTQIGMTFGRGWCLDSAGVVYFMASRGGVYRMMPGSPPESITDASLKKTLDSVDLSTTRVRLVWNDRDRGLHVFLTPWAAAATTHYFWHAPTASWWPDAFAATGLDPLSAYALDGDAPGDRTLLLGTRGGYVRAWDRAAKSDDGSAIDAYAVLGPIAASEDREMGMGRLEATLAAASNPVAYTVYGTNTPETLGAAKFTGTFSTAGRNTVRGRARGKQLFVKLANATLDQSFAVESAAAEVMELGAIR